MLFGLCPVEDVCPGRQARKLTSKLPGWVVQYPQREVPVGGGVRVASRNDLRPEAGEQAARRQR